MTIALIDFSRFGWLEWTIVGIGAVAAIVLFDLHKPILSFVANLFNKLRSPLRPVPKDDGKHDSEVNKLIGDVETIKRDLLLELRVLNSSIKGRSIDIDKILALCAALADLIDRLSKYTNNHIDDAIARVFKDIVEIVQQNKDKIQSILDSLTGSGSPNNAQGN